MRMRFSLVPGTVFTVLACMLLVGLLSSRVIAQDSASCPGAQEVQTLGPTTSDERLAFETTTDRFLVTYEADFNDDNDLENNFTTDIADRFGLVESDSTDVDATEGFIVAEDAGSFAIETDVEPENGATYTVTVEQCAGTEEGGTGEGGTFEASTNTSGTDSNAAVQQYDDEPPLGEDDVIVKTVPEKPLPNTGGIPLLALAGLLLVASIVVGYVVIGRR